jgi:hypothetical protein
MSRADRKDPGCGGLTSLARSDRCSPNGAIRFPQRSRDFSGVGRAWQLKLCRLTAKGDEIVLVVYRRTCRLDANTQKWKGYVKQLSVCSISPHSVTCACSVVLLLLASYQAARAQFTFTTNNGGITITGYTGPGGGCIEGTGGRNRMAPVGSAVPEEVSERANPCPCGMEQFPGRVPRIET